ncbi:zf-HC2 domain-containing protein, partial [Mediterraneibacter glycyrrhizinilyticus]
MKISCNIIKDILPLYLDGVVSDDTRQMVEEHLRTCDQCREEAVTLKQDVVLPASKSVRLAETEVVRGLKKKLFRKKFLVSAVSVIITIAILAGVYSYM